MLNTKLVVCAILREREQVLFLSNSYFCCFSSPVTASKSAKLAPSQTGGPASSNGAMIPAFCPPLVLLSRANVIYVERAFCCVHCLQEEDAEACLL